MPRRNAIIISISSDIGHALALDLANRDWDVAGTFRTPSGATRELEERGIALVPCDLSRPVELTAAVAQLVGRIDRWDLLVLAPGAQEPIGLFTDVDFAAWSAAVGVNFLQQLQLTQALLPSRNTDSPRGPCVLFFAGGGTNNATLRYSAYTISKIALIKMCELLDAEVPDTRFCILGPGWVKTKIHRATLQAGPAAGDNLARTQDHFARNQFVPMERVLACCRWIIDSAREVVGGRNFSAGSDACGDERLRIRLLQDHDMYKLRRAGNAWKP